MHIAFSYLVIIRCEDKYVDKVCIFFRVKLSWQKQSVKCYCTLALEGEGVLSLNFHSAGFVVLHSTFFNSRTYILVIESPTGLKTWIQVSGLNHDLNLTAVRLD